jgi:uncharacterized protein (DUF2267 family)
VNIIRATLETLGERLAAGEPDHVASQLPQEIGVFLKVPPERRGQPFSLEEFFRRVQRRSHERPAELVRHVRAVTEVLREAVQPNELVDMYAQLPDDFRQLFYAGPGPGESRSALRM